MNPARGMTPPRSIEKSRSGDSQEFPRFDPTRSATSPSLLPQFSRTNSMILDDNLLVNDLGYDDLMQPNIPYVLAYKFVDQY